MTAWQFNKGEWTEAYVFMRLLGEGRIYGASPELKKDDSIYLDIINIIKDEPDRMLIFERFIESNKTYINASKNSETINVITAPELSKYAQLLYDRIKALANKRVIEVPEVQKFLESFGIDKPKANLSKAATEKYGAKTDIIITSESSVDHCRTTEGFSIKSHIGSSATLFNSSQSSGFKFEIVDCDERGMHEVNSHKEFISIMNAIKGSYKLKYAGCRNEAFEQNIAIVDSRMAEILSIAVLIQASFYERCKSNVKDICDKIIDMNPIEMKNPQLFYPAKFKDFLFDAFAGLTASKVWNGRKGITGGYIDVSKNGDMLYYRAISDEIFGNYLFEHTYFDRPDRGYALDLAVAKANAYLEGRTLSEDEENAYIYKNGKSGTKNPKKGDFGYVYEDGGHFYIDLNFQIRFK